MMTKMNKMTMAMTKKTSRMSQSPKVRSVPNRNEEDLESIQSGKYALRHQVEDPEEEGVELRRINALYHSVDVVALVVVEDAKLMTMRLPIPTPIEVVEVEVPFPVLKEPSAEISKSTNMTMRMTMSKIAMTMKRWKMTVKKTISCLIVTKN
jgi:hypothetical protein